MIDLEMAPGHREIVFPGVKIPASGEVPEWLNGPVSKTGMHASVSWVRIPPSPPESAVSY